MITIITILLGRAGGEEAGAAARRHALRRPGAGLREVCVCVCACVY